MSKEEGQGREEDVARGAKRKAEEKAEKVSDEVKDRRQEEEEEDEESEEREDEDEDEEREEEQEDEENEEEEEDDDGYDSADDCWRCRDDMCLKHALRGFSGIVREVVRIPHYSKNKRSNVCKTTIVRDLALSRSPFLLQFS